MSQSEEDKKEFFKSLSANQESIVVSPVIPLDEKSILTTPLTKILHLDRSKLSKEAIWIIDTLEKDEDFPYRDLYISLKWKISSLVCIQDIFPGTIYGNFAEPTYFAKNYFYYEGLHLLREYFYCGFNNFLSASQHLLRTFIEFNIKQNYYQHLCRINDSFAPLKEYLESGNSPSSQTMANKFLPNDKISQPLKKKIQLILANLSKTSSHAYKPLDSIRGNGKLQHEYSMDSMFFWITLNHVINITLWSYYLVFPALFQPKNVVKKFGYNFPIGVFITDFQFTSIKNSLEQEDFKKFQEFSLNSQEMKDLNNFYEQREDLSDEEIRNTWKEEEELLNEEIGYYFIIGKARSLNEIMASKCTFEVQKTDDEDLEPLLRQALKFNWWENNYKKM
ncbi:MAG: hypothetical protein HUJ25_08690 [Crocinitomicaceae bacterium]|nr:hypothetical protein [Crocinitomicaceae bacterium]